MRPKRNFRWVLFLSGLLAGVGLLAATVWTGHAEGIAGSRVTAWPNDDPQEQATAEKPKLSLEERADLHMARKEYADAVEEYRRAIRAPGMSGEASASLWNRLGIAFQAQENYGAARKAYKSAIHFRSDFAEPWNNLGTTYFMQRKYRKSVKYYLRAIKLNPNSASFHMNLGTSFYHSKNYEKAVTEYRAALILDPEILTKHSTLGTIVETREADSRYYYYLAKAFANLGRVDEAVRYLRRAFEDGFHNLKELNDDPDFKKISKAPAYVELMKSPPLGITD